MFTGIVMALGRVHERDEHRLVVEAPTIDEPIGASIAVNGTCLTVVACHAGRTSFDLLPDTLRLTNLGDLEPGGTVNLEPALRVGDRMGGHWLQGHVDAVGTIHSVEQGPDSRDIEIEVPEQVLRYCIDRGSIGVNGVSLTVMGLRDNGVRVSLIPETQASTNLGTLGQGARVNLEADLLGKYVERLLAARGSQDLAPSHS